MEPQAFIAKMKELYEQIINFIESEDDDNGYQPNILDFENQISSNQNELKEILYILMKITDNHHRQTNFFCKIEQIFLLLEDKIKQTFSNSEIFDFFKENKRILLFLINKKFITIDYTISEFLVNKYCHFFYPEIKLQIDEEKRKQIEGELFDNDSNLNDFEENRHKGENDSYLCHLIRNDLVEEFIAFVNKTNLNLSNKINFSVFETNCFLIDKEPTIIEYAAFFGSIQIFNYLKFNNVQLSSSLWLYVIHSKKPEMIHLLEENQIQPEDKTYKKCLEESIKCHHNDIANYIQNNLLNDSKNITENSFDNDDVAFGFHYHNYNFITKDVINENKFVFYYACKYDYFEIVNHFMNIKDFDINSTVEVCRKNDVFNSLRFASENNNLDIVYLLLSNPKIEIGPYSFYKCTKLKKVEIPSSIKGIEEATFYNCISLTEVNIPSTATYIGQNGFSGCNSLISIVIPSSVTTIKRNAFCFCSSLKSIIIPPSVTSIDVYCFFSCFNLENVSLPTSLTELKDATFYRCPKMKQITIPSSIVSIGNDVFYDCSSLTEITIPSSVISIGNKSFYQCTSLVNVFIPSTLALIGSHAFVGCKSLQKVEFSSSENNETNNSNSFTRKQRIENSAFYKCSSLVSVSIPLVMKIVGKCSFMECDSLTEITIPPSVEQICSQSFYKCKSLKKVAVNSSIVEINKSAFNECSSLTEFTFDTNTVIKSIEKAAFSRCTSLTEFVFPASVQSINSNVFNGCVSLKKITVPTSMNTDKIGINKKTVVVRI